MKKIEMLAPDFLEKHAEIRLAQLQEAMTRLSARLNKVPDGHLRIVKHGKGYQYRVVRDKKKPNGKYLKIVNKKDAFLIAQKDYDLKLLKKLKTQAAVLKRFLKKYDSEGVTAIYEGMSKMRKQLVLPAVLPDEQFSDKWNELKFSGKPGYEISEKYVTSFGLKVRSKSELIIAEALFNAKVPFRYEFPLVLKNGKRIYPDFYCLNLKTRKEIYWEHFGMMDNPEYAENAVAKLNAFYEKGFFPGKNLVITMETADNPMNTARAVAQIKASFLSE